jgi:F-type H+-transporting ATPase subunit epsilon
MAEMMQFDLVSPERKLASFEASEVHVPGSEGDFTAMPDHAPFITTLRPGLLSVKGAGEVLEYVVTGGFVEISATSTSVLAEQALPKAEVTRAVVDGLIAEAEAAATGTAGAEKDAADKRVADTKSLLEALGL